MALSEHEQRLLDEMERRLYQSEADVVPASVGGPRRLNYRSLVLGILVALVGIGLLIGGAAGQMLWLGLIGFAVMLGGVTLMFSGRDDAGSDELRAEPQSKSTRSKETLTERMERRWDKRMEG